MAPIIASLLERSNALEARNPNPSHFPAQRDTSLHALARRTTIALSNNILQLIRRQSGSSIIPTTYGSINSGPSPGTVVGIVLGSVGGFLLLLWLIYTCLNFGTVGSRSSYTESVIIRDRRKSRGSTRSRKATETVEIRRERTPVRIVREPSIVRPQPERVERVIVEESRETRRERDRSLSGSDEVVVIEEHSPPRRKKSRTRREEDRDDRMDSGYRTVDPGSFAGVVGGRKSRR